jgi:hypothetical protein
MRLRFEVSTAVTLNIVFGVVTSCGSCKNRHTGGTLTTANVFLVCWLFSPWRWRWYVPPKLGSYESHSASDSRRRYSSWTEGVWEQGAEVNICTEEWWSDGRVEETAWEELRDLYFSPNTIRDIKGRRMRSAGHVARMKEKRTAYSFWHERQNERDKAVGEWITL